ncbi:MAG TPA: sialate O-acetylesterase [Candidatus Acidoferrum sp.]|nr:sialate O-acetylesterase [Candidatus Acidoferrum sp.]
MLTRTLLCACLTALVAAVRADADTNSVQLPVKAEFHLYLLMGQSNMAGRGKIEPEDRTPHPRVVVFTANGQWEPAIEPVTHDKPAMLGAGPGLAFGKAMARKEPRVSIGLVPCALGGTPLRRWEPGADLYSNAVQRAELAMRDGTLKGILWHQGESDSVTSTNARTYGERLAHMVAEFRRDLGCPNLPFVAGQIGRFLYERGPEHAPYARIVNDAVARLPKDLPAAAYVSSKGLKDKGDMLHFNSASQRELGRRYAKAMLKLQALANRKAKAESMRAQ